MDKSEKKLINNLSDALTHVTHMIDSSINYWFRGHSDVSFKLLPSLFRPVSGTQNQYYDEAQLIDEITRRFPIVRDKNKSIIELLIYAQHYGIPTRLLDWTENLLVALYFCCSEHQQKDGVVYILNPSKIQKHSHGELDTISEFVMSSGKIDLYKKMVVACKNFHHYFIKNIPPKINGISYIELIDKTDVEIYLELSKIKDKPLEIDLGISHVKTVDIFTYYAPMSNNRIIAQHGCFTIHGGKIIGNEEIVKIPQINTTDEGLTSLIIPFTAKKKIIEDLHICGINKHTLFPEIENHIESIKINSIIKTPE
ncbi:FRG domain-containing protein [Raoultella ornithinolytica]|uniref:FRG domain-containing protein n=1 Tax=Raoultella ornithinolytica TaxID=54291 RepID=UPI0027FC3C62|nr:FRG domain-containing protein [Raoultella ornithinolytica]MDV0598609.1 FRG domain-containing protein [Raoultella ornithinolytica]HDT6088482.1 FRG domain-containing protein [Raoultella ornithinolytica]